jgi:hypothetical protein
MNMELDCIVRSPSRRQLLRIGGLAFGGVSLPRLLRGDTGRRDISCIVMFQQGGASQIDTFDPKPGAPPEIRGSFKPIPTTIPGIHISETLPKTAAMMKHFSIIRTMRSDVAIHDLAQRYIFSGTRPRNELHHPSFGAVISKERGARNGLPPFVVVPDRQGSAEAGFLGSAYDQFVSGDPKGKTFSVKDVSLPAGMSLEEALANKRLLEVLDRNFQAAERSSLIDNMDAFSQKAFELISSPLAKRAFNINEEPQKLREAYGNSTVGQGALLCRRLIEAGVRLAAVYHGNYDSHNQHEPTCRKLHPEFDQAFATLLDDLHQRGLLASTLVLVIGEFGRTPKVNVQGGRDHWPGAFSVALAGAGMPGGAVIGRTDGIAAEPVDRPVSVEDLAATVYQVLGIDYSKSYHANGRPIVISKDGTPVKELFT